MAAPGGGFRSARTVGPAPRLSSVPCPFYHAGQLVRLDSVVSLPLRRLRDSGLPSVAEALAAIEQAL